MSRIRSPLERLSSHNACVFLHITVRCSHYRCLYTRIYYVRKKIAKHLHPHTPSTHLSPLNHIQTLEWQLVPCKPEISLLIVHQYSIFHSLLLIFIELPAIVLPFVWNRTAHAMGHPRPFMDLYNTEALKTFSTSSVCPATIM